MKVVDEARKRLKLAIDADSGNRASAVEDLQFAAGLQWPAEIEMQRQLEHRPCLTINKTDTFVRSVVNNMRQQRPRIKVHPVSSGADVKIADLLQGLIRHIWENSNADTAIDTAAEFQVRMGWGYWRIVTDYIAEDSSDQDICIERIRNPFSVYFDPSSVAPDGSDAEWCLITERMRRDAFTREYPNADPCDFETMGDGDEKAYWATQSEVIVAEYYRIEQTADTLYQLDNGARIFKSSIKPDVLAATGVKIVGERASMRRVLKWSKLTAKDELDSRELKGKFIPVVPVYGAELNIDGKTDRFGMVRQLKDPQRMYNFWRTAETEIVALAPKAPWLMAEGQDEGYEDEWTTANTRSYSSLKYAVVHDDQGSPLPPPQRQQPQQIPSAQVNAAMAASEDLKAVAGMFDPALGAPGQETSGRMVTARQGQSDLSNYHFYDNLTRSIRHTGKIILDLIPHYYDTQRVVRIIGEDGEAESVTLNDKQRDEAGAIAKVLNDVTVGCYDVVMDTGPGFQTKRQETAMMLMEMLKTELGKQIGQVAGDIIVRQMDIPGIDAVADRLQAANPLAQIDKAMPTDLPDEAKAFITHLMTQVKQLQGQLQQLTMEKQAHVFGEQARAQGKLQSDQLWAQNEQAIAQLREDSENRRLLAKEHAENERTAMQVHAQERDTLVKTGASWREAVLDAQTDIRLSQDRPPHNDNA